MRHWNNRAPEPDWVKNMTDEEVVQHFRDRVFGRFDHSLAGRQVRDMRKRLLKIMLDGLHCKATPCVRTEDVARG